MQEDLQFTEQSLREALDRLGSKTSNSIHRGADQPNNGRPNKLQFSTNAANGNSSFKKRRFINDGGVVVEHRNDLTRVNRKSGSTSKPVAERLDLTEHQEELIFLRRSLQWEKQHNHQIDAELEDLKTKFKSLETRLVHYQLQLEEREKQLSLYKEENAKLTENRKKEVIKAVVVSEPPPKKLIKKTVKIIEDKEPEPVKWWSGD